MSGFSDMGLRRLHLLKRIPRWYVGGYGPGLQPLHSLFAADPGLRPRLVYCGPLALDNKLYTHANSALAASHSIRTLLRPGTFGRSVCATTRHGALHLTCESIV